MIDVMSAAATTLERAVMPRRCVFCGIVSTARERFVCVQCRRELPYNHVSCPRCAAPATVPLPEGASCPDCEFDPPPVSATVTALRYEFPVDAAIKAMKFQRRLFYLPAFADLLAGSFARLPAGIDALAPVPLHWRRQAVRGFNQSDELCKSLRRHTGMRIIQNLSRVRATSYQSGLDAGQRRQNLQSAFKVRGVIAVRHVLLVDDVITTGETCRQIATLLLEHGVDRVSALAIAKA